MDSKEETRVADGHPVNVGVPRCSLNAHGWSIHRRGGGRRRGGTPVAYRQLQLAAGVATTYQSLTGVDLAILYALAFLTSTLSAVVGMAGGIVLLTVMLLYFEPLVAVPLHGLIQLISNSSRSYVQRRHIRWDLAWRYGLPLLPMGALGLYFATLLPAGATRALIGSFVLFATWRRLPISLGDAELGAYRRRFFGLGFVVGFLNPVIGAVGPLLAPFFLGMGLTRQALVGTKAVCQALAHVSKVILFGAVGFAFGDHLVLLLGMFGAVLAGTWLGSQLLEKVSEKSFVWVYRIVLTVVALRLVLSEAWELLTA